MSIDRLPDRLLEENYVRSTYEHIAESFSNTRYKKWPKVAEFLDELGPQQLLLDVGCGNGKYLDNRLAFNIGCDSSCNLLAICRQRGFEVVNCDMMSLPFRANSFDAIICIAALHHIVSEERRQTCLENMVELLSHEGGKMLIQVWSFEQELHKDNPYLSRKQPHTENREIEIETGTSLPVHVNRTPFKSQDVLVPFKTRKESDTSETEHLRYYHVFRGQELESMLRRIPNIIVSDSYYDKGNWCVIVKKQTSSQNSQIVATLHSNR